MLATLPAFNATVGSGLARACRQGLGNSSGQLAMAAGFVQCRLLSLRSFQAQQQQRRAATGLGPQVDAAAEVAPGAAGGAADSTPATAAAQLPLHVHTDHGSIELLVGPMFAGKTSALLQRVQQYEAAGLSVAVVKSSKDDRYDGSHVVTHDGQRKPCFAVPTLAAFREAAGAAYASYQVIAVDEAQFFPDLLDFSLAAADHERKHVVLAGLDGDFQRKRFGQVLDILPLADSVTKLHATCKFCQQEQRQTRAVFSLRIAADSRQEVVGGADKYAPVCRRHYVHLSGLRQQQQEQPDSDAEAAARLRLGQ